MSPTISNIRFVFDVESRGLHGEAFSVAYIVTDGQNELEANIFAIPRDSVAGTTEENDTWLKENVPVTDARYTVSTANEMRKLFWCAWLRWKAQGAQMFAECQWPVEARFLIQAMDSCLDLDPWSGPYPLHEIASFMAAAGMDPMASYPYEDGETKHDPLSDARQSARLLHKALNILTSKHASVAQ
jgi:hypothetical protein